LHKFSETSVPSTFVPRHRAELVTNATWYEEDGGKPEKSSLLKNKDEGSRVDVPLFARSKPKLLFAHILS
jgi:hypothetical protein